MDPITLVSKISNELMLDKRICSPRKDAWSSAEQNARDTVSENNLQQIIDDYDLIVPEFIEPAEMAYAAVTISSIRGILCSPDNYNLTRADINWFAKRGIAA